MEHAKTNLCFDVLQSESGGTVQALPKRLSCGATAFLRVPVSTGQAKDLRRRTMGIEGAIIAVRSFPLAGPPYGLA